MDDIIKNLTPVQALSIVHRLAKRGGKVREAVLEEAGNLLGAVDVEETAGDVFFALECLDVEDLWNQSGDHRYGYRTPDEEAQEMVEEELAPFLEQVRTYRKLGMAPQARTYCMGVLQGLYRFDQESETQFREWAEGVAYCCFQSLLDEWRKGAESPADRSEMNAFIKKACLEWASDVLKDER